MSRMSVNGTQQSLDPSARLLLDLGDRVVIETPCYGLAGDMEGIVQRAQVVARLAGRPPRPRRSIRRTIAESRCASVSAAAVAPPRGFRSSTSAAPAGHT